MTNECIEALIDRTLAGDRDAREALAEFIMVYVSKQRLEQLGPYCRDPDYRAEVCARVVCRFLVGACERLRLYRERPKRSFSALLRVVTRRVTIDLARSMSENVAPRSSSEFEWVEFSRDEVDHADTIEYEQRLELRDVYAYLERYPDPVAVSLHLGRLTTAASWQELADEHQLSVDAARQRVRRLELQLKGWRQRDSA